MKARFARGVWLMAVSGLAHAGLAEDLAAEQARVAQLQRKVAPLAASLQVPNNDLRVFMSLAPVVQAIAGLNALPASRRLIDVQSTGANGMFWQDGDWCHSFVELQGPGDLKASAELSLLQATVRDDGAIALSSRASMNGKVQVKFQFKGRRVHGPFGIGNVCPPGGGIGSSIGVTFDKVQDLSLLLSFSQAADGRALDYSVAFVEPKQVNVTASIGLGPIGNIGHPMSIDLPRGPVAAGRMALLISQSGTFRLPGANGERQYAFSLVPTSFASSAKGITATWKAKVEFKPPAGR